MGNIKPQVLLDIIDRERLDDLDKTVYDGTRKFIELCKPRHLSIATSDNYQLRFMGDFDGGYFSFMGQQGVVIADYLRPLPNELLNVANDLELMKIINEAKESSLRVSIPMTWTDARQMNHGLYNGAAQFEIKPPCLLVGANCKPEGFIQVVENLAEIYHQLNDLHVKRARES